MNEAKKYARCVSFIGWTLFITLVLIMMSDFNIAQADSEASIKRLASSNPEERAKAARELGEMGRKALRAVPTLIEMLNDSVGLSLTIYRKKGTSPCLRQGDGLPGIQAEPDTSPGIEAAKALAKIGDYEGLEKATGVLIKTLGDKKTKADNIRKNAAIALGWIGSPRAVEPLINALKDPQDDVRGAAALAFAISKIKVAHAVDPLITALNDKDERVRKNAANALGKIGDARAVGPLIVALERKDPDEGIKSLKDLGSGSLASLFAAAKNFREYLVEALGEIKDPRAIDPLIKALKDRDKGVARAAVCSLGQIKDPRAVNALEVALIDKDERVRKAAEWALREIESLTPESESGD
jgi:HEAT repeat protein